MEPFLDFEIIYDFVMNIDQHFLLCVSFISVVVCTILVISYWEYSWGGQVATDGKTVFITGCDSGFGLGLAHRLSSLNIRVIAACLSLNSDGAKELVNLANCDVIKCDVTSDSDVEKARTFVENHTERTGNVLWGIVNNAGIGHLGYFEWTPLDFFQKIYDVNAMGMVRILKALLPFTRRCSGRIVNVASQAGRYSVPALSPYAMSKHAVVALSITLRMELAQFGVNVSIIQPGFYRTPIISKILEELTKRHWIAAPDHIKRDYGQEFFEKSLEVNFVVAQKEARDNIYEVVDSMVHALVAQRPRRTYDGHWTTTVTSYVLLHILPDFIVDLILISRTSAGKAASVRS